MIRTTICMLIAGILTTMSSGIERINETDNGTGTSTRIIRQKW